MSSQIVKAKVEACVDYDENRTLTGFKNVILTWKNPFIKNSLWPEYIRLVNQGLKNANKPLLPLDEGEAIQEIMDNTTEYEFSWYDPANFENGAKVDGILDYRNQPGQQSPWAVYEKYGVSIMYAKIKCCNPQKPKKQPKEFVPTPIQQSSRVVDTLVVVVKVEIDSKVKEEVSQEETNYQTFGYDGGGREIYYNDYDEGLSFYNPRINSYAVIPYSYAINLAYYPTWDDYSCGNRQPIREHFQKFREEHPRREHHDRQPEHHEQPQVNGKPAGVPTHSGEPAGVPMHSGDPAGVGNGFSADNTTTGNPKYVGGQDGSPAGTGNGFSADDGNGNLKSANTRAQSNNTASNRRMNSTNGSNSRINTTKINSTNTGNNTRRVNSTPTRSSHDFANTKSQTASNYSRNSSSPSRSYSTPSRSYSSGSSRRSYSGSGGSSSRSYSSGGSHSGGGSSSSGGNRSRR